MTDPQKTAREALLDSHKAVLAEHLEWAAQEKNEGFAQVRTLHEEAAYLAELVRIDLDTVQPSEATPAVQTSVDEGVRAALLSLDVRLMCGSYLVMEQWASPELLRARQTLRGEEIGLNANAGSGLRPILASEEITHHPEAGAPGVEEIQATLGEVLTDENGNSPIPWSWIEAAADAIRALYATPLEDQERRAVPQLSISREAILTIEILESFLNGLKNADDAPTRIREAAAYMQHQAGVALSAAHALDDTPTAPYIPETIYRAVERALDENSAWIARPSKEVTEKVALAAGIAWQMHAASTPPSADEGSAANEGRRDTTESAVPVSAMGEGWRDAAELARQIGILRRAASVTVPNDDAAFDIEKARRGAQSWRTIAQNVCSAYDSTLSDAETEFCLACDKPFQVGDRYYLDASGGEIHAACCGPEREAYTGPDGEPLGPNDPIPEPAIWPAPLAEGGEHV